MLKPWRHRPHDKTKRKIEEKDENNDDDDDDNDGNIIIIIIIIIIIQGYTIGSYMRTENYTVYLQRHLEYYS